MNSEVSYQAQTKSLCEKLILLKKEKEVLEIQKLHLLEVYKELSRKIRDSEREIDDVKTIKKLP